MDHDIADGGDGYTIGEARLVEVFGGPLRERDLSMKAAANKDGDNDKKDTNLFKMFKTALEEM